MNGKDYNEIVNELKQLPVAECYLFNAANGSISSNYNKINIKHHIWLRMGLNFYPVYDNNEYVGHMMCGIFISKEIVMESLETLKNFKIPEAELRLRELYL